MSEARQYTVILAYPEHMTSGSPETYICSQYAQSLDEAVDLAQQSAAEANSYRDEMTARPEEFICLAVAEGNIKFY